MITIHVILGSVRPNRFGEKPAKWIMQQLQKQEDVTVELIDLRDWPLPFFNETVSPSMNGGKYSNELAGKWAQKVAEADGYVMVTPEYNRGYSAVLKNAIDYVYTEWNKKPVAFVSYGGIVAGARAVEQLRGVSIELQMTPIRQGVHLPLSWTQLDEQGNLKKEAIEIMQPQADLMIPQLLWYARLLKKGREEEK